MDQKTMACVVPGCRTSFTEERGWLPSLDAIKARVGRAIKAADLPAHAVCGRHAREAREQDVRMYAYKGTLDILARREAERSATAQFFGQYRPKTAMAGAFKAQRVVVVQGRRMSPALARGQGAAKGKPPVVSAAPVPVEILPTQEATDVEVKS